MRPRRLSLCLACAAMLVACTPAASPSRRTTPPRPGALSERQATAPVDRETPPAAPDSGAPGEGEALPMEVDLGNGMRLVPRAQRLNRPDCQIGLVWPELTGQSEAGFFQDTGDLASSGYQLCLAEDGVEIVFPLYELAPYVMGEPTAYLTCAQIAPLLIADQTKKTLFGSP